jgi:hypothetical protein
MVDKRDNLSSDYGTISMYFVFQDIERNTDDKISNYCDHSYNYSTNPQPYYLANLALNCQWNRKGDNVNKPYGFGFGYKDIFSIDDAEKLESMAKTLRKIEKKLHAINENDGYTDNFGEWVVRLCKIIGCEWGIKPDKESESLPMFSDKTYQWFSLADIRSYIEETLRKEFEK